MSGSRRSHVTQREADDYMEGSGRKGWREAERGETETCKRRNASPTRMSGRGAS
jgi:hypothetical protein